MKDPRLQKLAYTLVNYSVSAKKGDFINVRGYIEALPLMLEVIKEIHKIGAHPYYEILNDELIRATQMDAQEERYIWLNDVESYKNKKIDCEINLFATQNDYETSDVPQEIRMMGARLTQESSDIVINTKKWVLMYYPTPSLAQNAKMSSEVFEDFVIDVCNVDYSHMREAFKPLKELMEKTDKVRIVAPNTDITFSIKGIQVVPCAGEANIPDGEIYTAPVKDSVNGIITYNTPSPFMGKVYNNISFMFKDGKIIDASCDNESISLNKILDTDEGARYVGEFAIGVNPLIMDPMGNTLFDEKIAGSIHFTPGQCYESDANNGNFSAIHWDLVLIQRPEYGGGEIYFDDVLVRKDGLFVLEELKGLNPENLK